MPQFYPDFKDHALIPPQVPDFPIFTRSSSLRTIVIIIHMGFSTGGVNHNIVSDIRKIYMMSTIR